MARYEAADPATYLGSGSAAGVAAGVDVADPVDVADAAEAAGLGDAGSPLNPGGPVDVAMLVRRAAEGDKWAWERLVDQFGRLIWSITRDFRLPESDASDVFQATWLRLLEHIDRLEYPARVGSWIATTARHECLRCVAGRKRILLVQDHSALSDALVHAPEADEGLLAAERAVAVRDAMSLLPSRWQRMLELLMADPPASYAEISDQLGLPVGSIGPTRGRCMERLRVLLDAT
ncbi:MAG TPA: sigma-70 family RNA polymerase sigma factor [Streptosporangiaceae bacterium]|nr:sigma-70 family RNA polymerase sigma factor [Streptosporangiaceae bacterium]